MISSPFSTHGSRAAPVTTMGGVNESRLRQVVSEHFEVLWRFFEALNAISK